MERFLRNTAAELRVTFYGSAGTPVDATGTPTVTVTRDNGTAIVTDALTTKVTGTTGVYAYILTPAQTATLDLLTADWTGTVDATAQTFRTQAEVVGGFVCSIAQIDQVLDKGGTASTYSIDLKHAARNAATDAFEAECGVAFSPRYHRARLDGNQTGDIFLPHPRANTIRSATVDGVALTTTELADLEAYESGTLYSPLGWAFGRRNIEVVYEHGFSEPPADVSRAVAILAASALKDGPFDDRGYGVTDEGGAVRLLTAGVSGAAFSIPEVEAAAERHGLGVVHP